MSRTPHGPQGRAGFFLPCIAGLDSTFALNDYVLSDGAGDGWCVLPAYNLSPEDLDALDGAVEVNVAQGTGWSRLDGGLLDAS